MLLSFLRVVWPESLNVAQYTLDRARSATSTTYFETIILFFNTNPKRAIINRSFGILKILPILKMSAFSEEALIDSRIYLKTLADAQLCIR